MMKSLMLAAAAASAFAIGSLGSAETAEARGCYRGGGYGGGYGVGYRASYGYGVYPGYGAYVPGPRRVAYYGAYGYRGPVAGPAFYAPRRSGIRVSIGF